MIKLLQQADAIYNMVELQPVKGNSFDRAAMFLGGFTAVLPLLLEKMQREIEEDEEDQRFHQELGIIINEETTKFKQLPKVEPPTKKLEDGDEAAGTTEGM